MTLLALAKEIEDLTEIRAIWTRLCAGLTAHGIEHVIYVTVDAARRNPFLLCTLPGLYDDFRPEADPFLEWCCNTYTPTRTGQEFMADHAYLPPEAKAFITRAGRLGFRSGLGIPVRLTGSERYGGFNLGTGLDRAAFCDRIVPMAGDLRLLCLLVHRRIEELGLDAPAHIQAEDGFRRLMVAGDDPSGQLQDLSPREREVLYLVARGLSRKECARMCNISVHTVAEYVKSAYRKLGLRNRAEAALFLAREGGAP
ncbi:helix-turn-helix transcriptional regulator [Roseovarius aestuariivivens]|uniref:helix-turn-helix transcriptional regulator n=1 Tax=Roseovarius aestuariivivens TaxID=1888910 RepID=UPI00107FDF56|nr:LuxR family transcriptional regulator [Roseovarius aestuariivivens]